MDDLAVAVAAARAGGDVVRRAFGHDTATRFKGRFDPVTDVDRRSERAVLDVLRRERPADAILSEEGGGHGATPRRWIVDPLDGTVNFVHSIPHVSVSVGLYESDEPLVGVVLDPLRDELFTAVRGRGAHRNGTPLAVAATTTLERAVVVTGFPYDHGSHAAAYARTLGAVLEHVNGLRRFGSAALDLAWVAAGRFDGYWELALAPWDQAAGILLVREAGGRVTGVDGEDSVPETRTVLATNGTLHEPLRRLVAGSLPEHLR